MFSLFTSHSFSEKYSISDPEKFQDEKRKGYHCNLSNNINEKKNIIPKSIAVKYVTLCSIIIKQLQIPQN